MSMILVIAIVVMTVAGLGLVYKAGQLEGQVGDMFNAERDVQRKSALLLYGGFSMIAAVLFMTYQYDSMVALW